MRHDCWLRRLFHFERAARPRALSKPTFEPLEGRLCPSYTVIDLGPGSYNAHALNEADQVVGDNGNRAFLWENGVMTDLGTLGEATSIAYDINDSGQVVGASGEDLFSGSGDVLPPYRNFLWENGVMADIFLGTPELAINNAGQIVGGGAVVLEDGVYVSLPAYFSAHDINDHGQIVSDTLQVLLLTDDDGIFANGGAVLTDLGYNAWGYYSRLNNCGQVIAGYSLYSNGVTTNLGFFGSGINDAGQVVGTDFGWPDHAFLWQNGQATNLNNLIDPSSGWTLNEASDINERGDIVGTGAIGGEIHGFLLIDSSPPAPAALSVSDAAVTEGNMVAFTVSLSTASTETVTVNYASANGTATAGSDYQAVSGTLTFSPGETCKAIAVMVYGDTRDEYDETFFFNLSSATNAALVDGQGMATIVDDDPPPSLTIADVAHTEGNSGFASYIFTVTLSSVSDKTVSVNFATANGTATAGTDYQAQTGTLTFTPGETGKIITVQVNGDRVGEPNETFFLNLSNATNATIADGQGLGTIVDDEPRISISDVTRAEGHSGTMLFVFTVSLSAAYDVPITVNFATANGTAQAGQDYIAASGTLTFAPGETTKTISVAVKSDRRSEANETFFVNLSGAVGAFLVDGQGLGTILNDD